MPLANPYQQYRATAVKTSDGGDLLVMSYEAVLRWLGRAKTALAGGQIVDCHHALVNAQELVANLSLSLDFERAPAIAMSLRSIYDFVTEQLVQANVRKDPELIDQVEVLLRPLLEAWRLAVTQTKRAGLMPA